MSVSFSISPDVNITIDPVKLAAFVQSPNQPIMHDLMRRATNVQTGARHYVRKRTRALERSIVKRAGVDARGPYVLVVTEGVPYALYEHDGTRPHIIRPRRAFAGASVARGARGRFVRGKKVLRFPVGGVVVFAKVVHHPGTQGSKFLTRALPLAAR